MARDQNFVGFMVITNHNHPFQIPDEKKDQKS